MCYLVTYETRNLEGKSCANMEPHGKCQDALDRAESLAKSQAALSDNIKEIKVWKLHGEPVVKPLVEWKKADG